VEPLRDSWGREIKSLRVSVTDKCNFRCRYCMPAEGLEWLDRTEVLSFEEIARLVRVLARMGVDEVRLTGGEPLVRRDLPVLVEMLARTPDVRDLSLTTNGVLLDRFAEPLVDAGLRRLNVSLDSLSHVRFAEITRRDALDAVLRGLEEAERYPELRPIKVNCVAVKGFTETEVPALAGLARRKPYVVRFIEFMPLDADAHWSMDQVVPADETLAAIDAVYPLAPVAHGPEPAARYRYLDGRGEIGVIPSVTKPFCGDCDRIRITAEGKLRTCLFALDEHDLRAILRNGGSDDDLARAIEAAVGTKWAGHRIGQVSFVRPPRSMSQIGG
jgi:cyclic pyranopterin phosphate synthase